MTLTDMDTNKLVQQQSIIKRMTGVLRVQSILILVLTALGIDQIHVRHFLLAAAALVAAAISALIVFSFWKQYRKVKAGTAVYVVLAQPQLQMPQIVSLVVALFVTAFVSLCSAFVLYVINLYFRTPTGWTVCGATLLAMWLFVAHCWYRVLTDKPQVKPVLFQEQPEGVWPPAPLVSLRGEDTKRNG